MKKTKLLAMILSMVLAVSLFAGCGEDSNVDLGTMTKEEIETFEKDAGGLKLPLDKKGTTISILCDTDKSNNDKLVIQELRRRTGINVKLVEISRAAITEKAKVMVASKNEMPDIFNGLMDRVELNDLAMQGAFEPVSDHIDELPNFKSIFVDNAKELGTEKIMKGYTAADGKLYIFPGYDIQRDVNHGVLYRKDIFDKHSIPMWDGPESFYQALKQLKGIYPDSLPLVTKGKENFFQEIGQSWGLGVDSPSLYFNEDTRTWKYASTDPKYKELLDFIKKLYDEGLLDPEFLTDTQASWTSKMTQAEKSFVTFDWIGRLDMFYNQTRETVPEYDLRYANPIGPTQKVVSLSKALAGPCVKKSENSVLAMKLLDYLLSPNGAELVTCGIEGVTFNWNEDKTQAVYIDMPTESQTDIVALEDKYGLYVSGLYKRFDRRSGYFNFTEKEQEAQDLMLNKENGGFIPEPPELTLTAEEQELRTDADMKIRTAALEFATKYVLSDTETGDAAWNAWLAKAEQLGSKKVEDAYNAAQARYDAN